MRNNSLVFFGLKGQKIARLYGGVVGECLKESGLTNISEFWLCWLFFSGRGASLCGFSWFLTLEKIETNIFMLERTNFSQFLFLINTILFLNGFYKIRYSSIWNRLHHFSKTSKLKGNFAKRKQNRWYQQKMWQRQHFWSPRPPPPLYLNVWCKIK